MSKKIIRPSRLDLVDLPRDKGQVLGGLRKALCASYNYCRRYPLKLQVLKETIIVVLEHIEALEKEQAEQTKSTEQAAKRELDERAEKAGIKLDARKSLEDMKKDLAAEVAKRKEQAGTETAKPTAKQAEGNTGDTE